jgi:predicted amidohydrolase YtcJ
MKEVLASARSLTKEDIKRAAVLSLHTYEGATAGEWQDQAGTLREGDGGDTARNEDANLSQMIADALREMDEDLADNARRP